MGKEILDPSGDPVPPEKIAAIRVQAMEESDRAYRNLPPLVDAPYRSGWFDDQATTEWLPGMGSADANILPSRDIVLARVRDMVRNDPTARAARDRLVDHLVGAGLHLSSRPDAVALNITPDQARALGREIKKEWRLFGFDPRRSCDAQQRLSINGLFRLAAASWIVCGEATAYLPWRAKTPLRYSTSILSIDPDRLSNPYGQVDSLTMRGGVQMDEMGMPIGYHVRDAHASDWWAYGKAWSWTYVPRYTPWGRPVFVHAFEPDREGETRPISPFAALVLRLKMVAKFAENELASAALNALLCGFIETQLPTDEVAQRLTQSETLSAQRYSYGNEIAEFFKRHPARVGGTRLGVLPPGTKAQFNNAPRQTTAFPAFEAAFLQKIASSLGLSYEQLSMDWSKTNYSSARAALNETYRSIKRLHAAFVDQFVTPVFFAFMEEAFARGYLKEPTGAPKFAEMPGAYMTARWIFPGRGYIDPLKEAQAAAMRMESFTSTLERECAEQGEDWEENAEQIAYEEKTLKELGLTRQSLIAVIQSTRGPKPDSEDAQGAAGVDGDETGKEASNAA